MTFIPPISIWKRLAADVSALINGTTGQTLHVYNTDDGAGNLERFMVRWTANICNIGSEISGTGTLRSVRLFANSFLITIGTTAEYVFGSSAFTPAADTGNSLGTSALRFLNGFFSSYVRFGSTTVGSLPAASTAGAGARMFVTDALTPIFMATVAAGGAVFTPVYSDGTNWKVG